MRHVPLVALCSTASQVAICAPLIFCVAACGQQDSRSAQGGCDFMRSPTTLDARKHLDFPAQEVLDFSEKGFDASLRWSDQRAAVISPAVRPAALHVDIRYEDGSIEEVHSEQPACEPSLQVEVSVDLSSVDGTFAEHRMATLSAFSGTSATVALEIPMNEFNGTLSVVPSAKGWSITALELLADITPDGISGEILALSMRNEGGDEPTHVDPDLAAGEFRIADWK